MEVVRAACEAWNKGDTKALRALYDADLVMDIAEGCPGRRHPVGREAVFREIEQLREAWHDCTLEPIGGFIDAGDRVLVRDV